MSHPDRPTPPDPHRAAKPPRPAPQPRQGVAAEVDARQVAREAESAKAKLRPVPPPLPARPQERKATPQSGGIVAPGSPVASPAPIPVTVADSEPPLSKAPTRGDWAKLGFKVAGLGYKVLAAAAAALVLVIAAAGFLWVARLNAETDAIKAKAAKVQDAKDDREKKWKSWAAVAIWILDCRDKRDVKSGEMLLPDPQKMGSARKMEAWQNNCPTELPPPP